MKYRILSKTDQELYQANILVTVDYTDLVALGAVTTGSIKLAPYGGGDGVTQPYSDVASPPQFAAGTLLTEKAMILDTPFVFSDGSLTSCTVTIGDGGSAARYQASTELNTAGSFVTYSIGTGTKFVLTAADSLIAAFAATSSKNLNTATAGSARFFFKAEDLTQFATS